MLLTYQILGFLIIPIIKLNIYLRILQHKEDKYRKQAHRNTEHQQSVREIFRYLINLRTLPFQQKIGNWSNCYNREGSKKCLRQD